MPQPSDALGGLEIRKVIIRRRVRPSRAPRAVVKEPDGAVKVLDNQTLAEFNPTILGLGDIAVPSREIDAIAAVFDLAGFTRFCNQVDPHLAVPRYLSAFLEWLFERVKAGLTETSYANGKSLWAELPFMAKFLGDGALLLWDTRYMNDTLICNIATTLYDICYEYRHQFYPEINTVVDSPPAVLRCGIARGRVFSVGNGRDYVGHCINTASRLQKLSLLTFCFPARGFNVQRSMDEAYRHLFLLKRISIRGVGANELVWVLEHEFNKLPENSQGLFREP